MGVEIHTITVAVSWCKVRISVSDMYVAAGQAMEVGWNYLENRHINVGTDCYGHIPLDQGFLQVSIKEVKQVTG